MGTKPSNNYQSDRPESGGADRDGEREKSGLLDLEKEKFAQDQAEKRANPPEQTSERHQPFSIDNPPDNDPRHK